MNGTTGAESVCGSALTTDLKSGLMDLMDKC
jgi:hypothetical protein